MPTSNQQEAKGSVSSQLQAINDAYGGTEPCSPAILEPHNEENTETIGTTDLKLESRKSGLKRTASYNEKIEDDSQTNPDKIEEGTSPRKRSKVDNGTNEGDHTKISEPLGQTPQEWQHKVGSQSSGSDEAMPPPPPGENVDTCVQRIRNEAIQLLIKWKESFLEGEAFESFCPSRMDALLKEARTVEENLKEQKDALKSRLQQIAHTLEMLS